MINIMLNLPKEYDNIVENLEDELDDDIDLLTIKIIWGKLQAKNSRTNAV